MKTCARAHQSEFGSPDSSRVHKHIDLCGSFERIPSTLGLLRISVRHNCPFAPHPREAAVSRICNHCFSVLSVDGSNLQILRLTSFVTRPVRFQSETKMFRSESTKQPCAALNRSALMSWGSSS